jgi:hypothetical protein
MGKVGDGKSWRWEKLEMGEVGDGRSERRETLEVRNVRHARSGRNALASIFHRMPKTSRNSPSNPATSAPSASEK